MKITPHILIAAIAVLLALIATSSPLLRGSANLAVDTIDLKVKQTKEWNVIPASVPLNPLVDEFSAAASKNPFTAVGQAQDTPVPLPPPPPLDLPIPPVLPLPEK